MLIEISIQNNLKFEKRRIRVHGANHVIRNNEDWSFMQYLTHFRRVGTAWWQAIARTNVRQNNWCIILSYELLRCIYFDVCEYVSLLYDLERLKWFTTLGNRNVSNQIKSNQIYCHILQQTAFHTSYNILSVVHPCLTVALVDTFSHKVTCVCTCACAHMHIYQCIYKHTYR